MDFPFFLIDISRQAPLFCVTNSEKYTVLIPKIVEVYTYAAIKVTLQGKIGMVFS